MDETRRRFTGYLLVALERTKADYKNKKGGYAIRVTVDERKLEDRLAELEQDSAENVAETFLDSLEKRLALETRSWAVALVGTEFAHGFKKLKPEEQETVFRYIFLNQDFAYIGKMTGKTKKQAQQSYYYAVRKMRRQKDGI